MIYQGFQTFRPPRNVRWIPTPAHPKCHLMGVESLQLSFNGSHSLGPKGKSSAFIVFLGFFVFFWRFFGQKTENEDIFVLTKGLLKSIFN